MMRFLFITFLAALSFGCIVRPTEKRIVYKPFDEARKADTILPIPPQQVVPDSLKTNIAEIEHPQLAKGDSVVANPPAETAILRFHLVAASFKSSANAENYHAKLLAEGYQSRLIVLDTAKSTSPYKVSFASFATKADAQEELQRQNNNGAFAQTWVLEIKP